MWNDSLHSHADGSFSYIAAMADDPTHSLTRPVCLSDADLHQILLTAPTPGCDRSSRASNMRSALLSICTIPSRSDFLLLSASVEEPPEYEPFIQTIQAPNVHARDSYESRVSDYFGHGGFPQRGRERTAPILRIL